MKIQIHESHDLSNHPVWSSSSRISSFFPPFFSSPSYLKFTLTKSRQCHNIATSQHWADEGLNVVRPHRHDVEAGFSNLLLQISA